MRSLAPAGKGEVAVPVVCGRGRVRSAADALKQKLNLVI